MAAYLVSILSYRVALPVNSLIFAKWFSIRVTPLVDVSIVVSFPFPVRFGWNNRGCAALIKILQEPIGVESLVGQQRCEGDIVDQRSNPLHVVRLPRQKQKAEQVAERIDQGDDPGRQPAARASNGLMPCPPFAPSFAPEAF